MAQFSNGYEWRVWDIPVENWLFCNTRNIAKNRQGGHVLLTWPVSLCSTLAAHKPAAISSQFPTTERLAFLDSRHQQRTSHSNNPHMLGILPRALNPALPTYLWE
jgi:hypothetical protein